MPEASAADVAPGRSWFSGIRQFLPEGRELPEAEWRSRHRIILAGGLDASNVARAISLAQPWGVDSCSRIESAPGIKDHMKMIDFLLAAKAALQGDIIEVDPGLYVDCVSITKPQVTLRAAGPGVRITPRGSCTVVYASAVGTVIEGIEVALGR